MDDVSLLTLKADAVFNAMVQPACIWKNKDATQLVGKTVTTSGYGLETWFSNAASPIMRDTHVLKIVKDSESPACKAFKVEYTSILGEGKQNFFLPHNDSRAKQRLKISFVQRPLTRWLPHSRILVRLEHQNNSYSRFRRKPLPSSTTLHVKFYRPL